MILSQMFGKSYWKQNKFLAFFLVYFLTDVTVTLVNLA